MKDMDLEDDIGVDDALVTMSTESIDTALPRTSHVDSSSESWEESEGVSLRKKECIILTGKLSTSFVAMTFICQSS
jgi:hypothetical protein